MRFLHDRQRTVVLGVLGALLGAAALFVGAGGASAGHCNTMPNDPGNLNFEVPHVAGVASGEIGMDHDNFGSTTSHGTYWCVWTPQAGGHHVAGSVHLQDANAGTPGIQFDFAPACPDWTCPVALQTTGAEVAMPSTSTTTATSRPGGAVSTGTGTCVYVNGTAPAPGTTCSPGLTVAGVNIATGDPKVSTRTVSGGCVGAAGNPCITTVPSGAAVTVGGGDATNKTVDGEVTGVPVEYDLTKTCVVNVFTDCTTP